jgi:predicted transcriptional regulator
LVNLQHTMSETELKKRLITRIQRSRNSALLREAYRLMGTDAADLEPYILSKEQKASIAKGKKDIKEGRTLTAAKANKAIDEWLGK